MRKPISINDLTKKNYEIPDLVIVIVDSMLKDRWQNNSAILFISDIIKSIQVVCNKTESEILNKHWLDIEPIYRQAGYDVEYHKPEINSIDKAYFKFSKPYE